MVGLPTRFLWDVDDGKVSVIWIVKVTRVVDVYYGLVWRSRSGGVGWVEEAGDVRGAGGWVEMFDRIFPDMMLNRGKLAEHTVHWTR